MASWSTRGDAVTLYGVNGVQSAMSNVSCVFYSVMLACFVRESCVSGGRGAYGQLAFHLYSSAENISPRVSRVRVRPESASVVPRPRTHAPQTRSCTIYYIVYGVLCLSRYGLMAYGFWGALAARVRVCAGENISRDECVCGAQIRRGGARLDI
jgi:hypothetical protein